MTSDWTLKRENKEQLIEIKTLIIAIPPKQRKVSVEKKNESENVY